jgi:predicted negative regulator of RcsB-dependent stress response
VSTHLTEEEQVEALKRWWSENGKSVIGGIVLGLGLVFGWQGWNQHQKSQAEMASAEYDRMLLLIDQGDLETAGKQAGLIGEQYEATAYDYFAALQLARALVNKNDLPAARTQLEFALAHADDDGLAQVARIRLARVLMAMDKFDEATAVINSASHADAFKGDLTAIKADIARLQGDAAAAATAYEQALQENASLRAYVEMKRNDVKTASPNS